MAKILLVSDDEKQNKLITQILSKTPAAVITSVDESAVLNYVEKALVSLVLIDESIKTLDALILCKKMQAYTLKENIAVISLVDSKTENIELLKITNACVTKPVNDKILSACVASNLKLKKLLIHSLQTTANLQRAFISWMFCIIPQHSLQGLWINKSL